MNNNIIYQLDQHTINQIAAGEVIEDPSSVVKELVENAIDAEATHIIIKIKDGGKELIEIFDNGKGMSKEDMKVCYLKHTTSKIKTANDINTISTMGFRGEALASISSVSKFTIQSKREIDEYGYQIKIENSQVVNENVCAFSKSGTRIIVENLFYNIPARRSFLDKEKSTKETKYIIDMAHRLNLTNPHISFEVFIDDFIIFKSTGNGVLQNLLAEIYDVETARKLLYFETNIYEVNVRGYISKPENCVGNKTKQSFFVNNRYVKMDILSVALKQGYNEYAVTKRYPVCAIFIDLPYDQIDINAHPRKTEIRFKHEIFPVIYSAVSQCLFNNKSIPTVNFNNTKNDSNKNLQSSNLLESFSFVNNNTSTKISNESFENQSFDDDLDNLTALNPSNYDNNSLLNDKPENNISEEFEVKNIETTDIKSNSLVQIQFDGFTQSYQNGFKQYENMKVIGQVHNSYIIAEHNTGIIMIDQHAAHERVLYEKFLKSFDNNNITSIENLIPLTIELSVTDYLVIKDNIPFFEKYGFYLDDFGMKTFIIRKYPSIFKDSQIKNMVLTMISEILKIENTSIVDDLIHKKIIMRSCKSAIKANMILNIPEIESLLNDLVRCDNPYHCPHGRPIMFNVSTYDIEKSFNRVV